MQHPQKRRRIWKEPQVLISIFSSPISMSTVRTMASSHSSAPRNMQCSVRAALLSDCNCPSALLATPLFCSFFSLLQALGARLSPVHDCPLPNQKGFGCPAKTWGGWTPGSIGSGQGPGPAWPLCLSVECVSCNAPPPHVTVPVALASICPFSGVKGEMEGREGKGRRNGGPGRSRSCSGTRSKGFFPGKTRKSTPSQNVKPFSLPRKERLFPLSTPNTEPFLTLLCDPWPLY